MIIKIIDRHYIRKCSWGILYTAECDCGCTKTRHIALFNSKTQPSETKAKQIAEQDYADKNQR